MKYARIRVYTTDLHTPINTKPFFGILRKSTTHDTMGDLSLADVTKLIDDSGSEESFDGEGLLGSDTEDDASVGSGAAPMDPQASPASNGSGAAVEDAAPTEPQAPPAPAKRSRTPEGTPNPGEKSVAKRPSKLDEPEFDAKAMVIVQGERDNLFQVEVDGVVVFEGKKMATRKFICEQAGCSPKDLARLGIKGCKMLNKLTVRGKPADVNRAVSGTSTPEASSSPAKPPAQPKQKKATAPVPAVMKRVISNEGRDGAPVSPAKRTKKPQEDMNVASWSLDRMTAFVEEQAASTKPGPYLAEAASVLGVESSSLTAAAPLISRFKAKRTQVNAAVDDLSTAGRQRCAILFGELAAIMGELTTAGLDADTFGALLDEGKVDIERLSASFGHTRTDAEKRALSKIEAFLNEAIPMVKKALAV